MSPAEDLSLHERWPIAPPRELHFGIGIVYDPGWRPHGAKPNERRVPMMTVEDDVVFACDPDRFLHEPPGSDDAGQRAHQLPRDALVRLQRVDGEKREANLGTQGRSPTRSQSFSSARRTNTPVIRLR